MVLQFGEYVGVSKGLGEVTFMQRFEGGKKVSHAAVWWNRVLDRRNGNRKGPEVGVCQVGEQRGGQVPRAERERGESSGNEFREFGPWL